MAKVAWIGSGVMGNPHGRSYPTQGHELTVPNRTAAKAEAWAKDYAGWPRPPPRRRRGPT